MKSSRSNETGRGTSDADAGLVRRAAELIAGCRRLVVLTGAGVSRESGIPVFRGPDGLWEGRRPEELASREGFLSNPGLVWRWYRARRAAARDTPPNAGHRALGELERLVPRFLLITQNVDGLHRAAGSREIVELHGSLFRFRCFERSHAVPEDPAWGDDPPLCRCGSLVRPDVVWFGEPLPQAELECSFRESRLCDVFLLVGTSGVVQPATLLPLVAAEAHATLVEVNIEPSTLTHAADLFLEGKSGELLPALVDAVRSLRTG